MASHMNAQTRILLLISHAEMNSVFTMVASMWGSRVIVPPQGRNFIIEELHDTHPGISRMKSLARSYVWWPNIDRDLETKAKQCRSCQST